MFLLVDDGGTAVEGDIDPSALCALLGSLLVSAIGLALLLSGNLGSPISSQHQESALRLPTIISHVLPWVNPHQQALLRRHANALSHCEKKKDRRKSIRRNKKQHDDAKDA